MTRWHALEPADADFLASAPHIFRYQKRCAASPEKVWESLVSDESLTAWGPMIKDVTWTSPRPFGVGTTREVTAPGGSVMRERSSNGRTGIASRSTSMSPRCRCSSASPSTTSSSRQVARRSSPGPSRLNQSPHSHCRSRCWRQF
jgi:hypothetical protein